MCIKTNMDDTKTKDKSLDLTKTTLTTEDIDTYILQNNEKLRTKKFICHKCNTKCLHDSVQRRRADEGMTQIYRCPKCTTEYRIS